ncbi:MAG: DUF4180 domain-containing protein [Sediminicola sp.]
MNIEIHRINDLNVAELVSSEIIIKDIDSGIELLGDLYYQDLDRVLVHEKNITPDFFDLKNCMAGEILQKFANYRVRLAMVGDFSKYTGNSIKAFIHESNRGHQVNFLPSRSEALKILSTK